MNITTCFILKWIVILNFINKLEVIHIISNVCNSNIIIEFDQGFLNFLVNLQCIIEMIAIIICHTIEFYSKIASNEKKIKFVVLNNSLFFLKII